MMIKTLMTIKTLRNFYAIGLAGLVLTACAFDDPQDPLTILKIPNSMEEILAMPAIGKALTRYADAGGHKAIALSEDDSYSLVEGGNSREWVAWNALRQCNERQIKRSSQYKPLRGCFLYMVNDAVVAMAPTGLLAADVAGAYQKLPEITYSLGADARRGFEKYKRLPARSVKAFAVSASGEWDYVYDYRDPEEAAARAESRCNSNLGLARYESACKLYALNDTIVAPLPSADDVVNPSNPLK